MADWIPGISQLKSGFQLLCLDPKGALETQKKFVKQCPVVSQVTSVVQVIAGDTKGALETQKECLGTVSRVLDGIPAVGHVKGAIHYAVGHVKGAIHYAVGHVKGAIHYAVGHVKGAIHYAVGDTEGGHQAMRSATRTTAVLGAGAAGMLAGPAGAVAAGVAAGVGMDTIYSAATDQPQGYYAAIKNLSKNPSAGGVFDLALMPAGDGLTGYAGGSLAKSIQKTIRMQEANQLYKQADALLEAVEANEGSMTSAEYMAQNAKAQQLFDAAKNIEAKINGPVLPSNLDAGTLSEAADWRQLGDGLLEDASKYREYLTKSQYEQLVQKADYCYKQATNAEASGAAAAQTTTGPGGTSGNLAVIGEPATHTQDANDASGQKKGHSASTGRQKNNEGGKQGGSSNTPTGQKSTTPTSGGSGQDPNKEQLPNLKSSHYDSDERVWIANLLRSLGQLRLKGSAGTRGFDANADTSFTANRAIVEEMIGWVNTSSLSEAARNYIINTLAHLEPLTNFYQYSTLERGIVQFRIKFEMENANGDEYPVQFDIDVDNQFQSTRAHMGYEIRLNNIKVQVGHLYLPNVPIGRPPLAVFDTETTTIDTVEGPRGEKHPIEDKEGKKNGKGTWKCTRWKLNKKKK